MHPAHRYAALLSLSAALIATGCKQPAANDATVTAAVQARLASDPAIGIEPIQSSVRGGVATLNGAVSSDAARVLAGNDAAQVAGVRTVLNNLTVQAAGGFAPQNLPPQGNPPAPAVTVNTPPSRVRTIPTKPTAALERQTVAKQPTPAPVIPAAGDRPAQQPAAPAQPAFRTVNLPAGTSIPVRMTQTLDSATTQQGATFSGSVASDVMVDGLVAIPQGSGVSGRVDTVHEAAHFSGNSLLTIEVTSISRRGERIPVTTEAFSKEGASRGKNTAIKTGAGAAAGAILGGIFGGGKGAAIGAAAGGGTGAGINAVTRGQQVQIPSESLVPFRLSNSISIRVPTRNDARPRDQQDQGNQGNQGNQVNPGNLPDQQNQPVQPDQGDPPRLHRHPPS